MSDDAKFAIFRAGYSGYQPVGQIAQRITLDDAMEQIKALKGRYPNQEFVIMGEVGSATRSDAVTVNVAAPDLGDNVVIDFSRAKGASR